MMLKRGRPATRCFGVYRDQKNLRRCVASIVKQRDKHDPESITDVTRRLVRLAERIVPPSAFSEARKNRLRRLAATAKASQITRELVSWRFGMTDRAVRAWPKERPNIFYMIWA
jgi:hypothetical protein